MKVVVADTSPINYLILIGEIEILYRLWRRILIPAEVLRELTNRNTPPAVCNWAMHPPEWLEVKEVAADESLLDALDTGEACAIALAQVESDALLLIDDAEGRREALRRNIRNTGTLGILRAAAQENLVNLTSAMDRLLKTNFRVSRQLVAELIAEDLERNQAR